MCSNHSNTHSEHKWLMGMGRGEEKKEEGCEGIKLFIQGHRASTEFSFQLDVYIGEEWNPWPLVYPLEKCPPFLWQYLRLLEIIVITISSEQVCPLCTVIAIEPIITYDWVFCVCVSVCTLILVCFPNWSVVTVGQELCISYSLKFLPWYKAFGRTSRNLCWMNENYKGYFCLASIGIGGLVVCSPYK